MVTTNLLALTSVMLLVLCSSTVGRKVDCTDVCCLFVENVPGRLKSLRNMFQNIRSYYEDNEDLGSVLLDDGVLHTFKSRYGCHAVNDVLRFYRDTVLPAARNHTLENETFKLSIDWIGEAFEKLMQDIVRCKNYFSCVQPFDINNIATSYNGMKKGMYKAMGELDVLFNYIEEYLVSKRRRH